MTGGCTGATERRDAVTGVRVGRLQVASRVLVAAGPPDAGGLWGDPAFCLDGVGGIVTKTVTPAARSARDGPATWRVRGGGLVNAIGLANAGPEGIEATIGRIRARSGPRQVVVSLAAAEAADLAILAGRAEEAGADALEINVSCPNAPTGADAPRDVSRAVAAVRAVVTLPVLVKLPPDVDGTPERVRAAADAGADAVTLTNTIPALVVERDPHGRAPGHAVRLRLGGMSGAGLRPVSLRCVYEAARLDLVPVVACGGIATLDDALDALACGAVAVQIGSVLLDDPGRATSIAAGLRAMHPAAAVPA